MLKKHRELSQNEIKIQFISLKKACVLFRSNVPLRACIKIQNVPVPNAPAAVPFCTSVT
jgi:hypothetical protein